MNLHKPLRIKGMGKYLPSQIKSEELERKLGIPSGWSAKHSGVCTRHHATFESNGYMGARAAEEALERCNMTLAEIDLIISASGTYDYPLPNQASVIKAEMKDGMQCHTPAIHLDSTCLSFVAALEMAAHYLDGRQYKNILIVTSEIASKGLNPENWETSTLFGDGAAAVVVAYDEASYLIKGMQLTFSAGAYDTIIEGGGNKNFFRDHPYDPVMHSFRMNGRQLLRLAGQLIPEFMDSFFQDLDIRLEDIPVIIPHQASRLGMQVFKKQYDLNATQVKESLERYGNCIAASIPLTLYDVIERHEISRGDLCFLSGTSAGFSIGGVLIRY
jgi:3-oxoacyl-[acyl-carrier-protein] synthase-3